MPRISGRPTVCQVHLGKDKTRTYALKKMKKQFIVDAKQQQHVMQEKRLLLTVRCPFIVRYRTKCRRRR